jgi:hypothetical protein
MTTRRHVHLPRQLSREQVEALFDASQDKKTRTERQGRFCFFFFGWDYRQPRVIDNGNNPFSRQSERAASSPLRVQKAGRHHGTLVIAQSNRLLLLSDHNAYTGPTIIHQSRRRSRAQGHNAHILCGERVPRLEVISN